MPTLNAMLSVEEEWQASEQLQVARCNSFKSVETPTSCDYVEQWISALGNSLFFLPTTSSNLSSLPWQMVSSLKWRMASPIPHQWTVSSLDEQPPPSLEEWCPSSLVDERLPPSLEEQHPPSLVDKWHPPLKNGSLPWRMPPSLNDEWHPPSQRMVSLIDKRRMNSVFPPLSTNGSLPWRTAPSLDDEQHAPSQRMVSLIPCWQTADKQHLPSLVNKWLCPLKNGSQHPEEWFFPSTLVPGKQVLEWVQIKYRWSWGTWAPHTIGWLSCYWGSSSMFFLDFSDIHLRFTMGYMSTRPALARGQTLTVTHSLALTRPTYTPSREWRQIIQQSSINLCWLTCHVRPSLSHLYSPVADTFSWSSSTHTNNDSTSTTSDVFDLIDI